MNSEKQWLLGKFIAFNAYIRKEKKSVKIINSPGRISTAIDQMIIKVIWKDKWAKIT